MFLYDLFVMLFNNKTIITICVSSLILAACSSAQFEAIETTTLKEKQDVHKPKPKVHGSKVSKPVKIKK